MAEIPKKAQGRPPGSRYAITGESRIFKCAKAKCTKREQKNICCAVRAWAKKAGAQVTCRAVPGAVEVYRIIKYGCHCDLLDEDTPDGCVIDTGRYQDCVYAVKGGKKESCEYWKPIK